MDIKDLTTEDVYDTLRELLPIQNDFAASDYIEELEELHIFGIRTNVDFVNLLMKRKEEAMLIDAQPLDDFHVKVYKSEYGDEYIQNKIENRFWFAYPALLRIILQLEFGQQYMEFANKRDNI